MVRTQIQLTGEQADQLKRLAAARGRSMADLVREGVDHLLRENGGTSRGDLMHRAAVAFGAFRSGSGDGAARHDEHFAAAVVRTR
jgi:Arc/MetJ-type ribon-helix-helix transcriptional regulator